MAVTEGGYLQKLLFDGAMTVDVPSTYIDVSQLREVPDNQEVYLDQDGYTSITVDLLEYVKEADVKTLEDAIRYHYADIARGDDSTSRIWQVEPSKADRLPEQCISLFATQHPSAAQRSQRPETPVFTGVLLVLIRLPKVETDICITVNVPHIPGQYDEAQVDLAKDKWGPLLEQGSQIQQRLLETFQIHDWGLFGGGDDDDDDPRA